MKLLIVDLKLKRGVLLMNYKIYGDWAQKPHHDPENYICTVDSLAKARIRVANNCYDFISVVDETGKEVNIEMTDPRNFMLFGGVDYYPLGGFNDFIESFCTLDDAMEFVKANDELPHAERTFEWWHIVNSNTLAMVQKSD